MPTCRTCTAPRGGGWAWPRIRKTRPGRLILIGRFGAGEVAARLPALMRATRAAGRKALWSIDPMHGNTVTVAGRKTRTLPDIVAELRAFFEIAAAERVHPGGIHLE